MQKLIIFTYNKLKHNIMKNLVNTTDIRTVNVLGAYPNTTGKFRFIVRCRAGWMTISDARDFENESYMKHPESLLTSFTKRALQTIEFQPEGSNIWLTVFARKGNKIVLMDEVIMENLTVGTINQYWSDTNLYNQSQYGKVEAKTWADRAFVNNVIAGVDFTESLKQLEAL
jgi:hypothetical protein